MRRSIGEMFRDGWYDVTRAVWYGPSFNALRSLFSDSFFQRPRMEGTVVNYDLARSLYRNDNPKYNLGAGFVRPIIDLPVEYMGLPMSSSTANDSFLNECIHDHWAPQLQQLFRDTMRDSKVIVRFRQPLLTNPLFTEQDRTHGKIDLLPPEVVQIDFDPSDPELIERAAVTHFVKVDLRTDEDLVRGLAPMMEEHEVIEVITPDAYRFFDKRTNTELTDWSMPNTYKFVPLWPSWNEYSSELGGGVSDIEPVLPFIEAFHEVLEQTLEAHKYHSTPKASFNLKDIAQFLRNNYPEVLDDNGKVKPGATIDWSGRQVILLSVDEKAGFVEAKSVLGDSKTLLEFLIDCIAIASETPKWALLANVANTPETDATVQPFEKKITRKRIAFSEVLVMICKMCLVANGKTPDTPRLAWPPVRLTDLVNKAQAIQQIILGMDVAASHEWLADATVVKILGTLFSEVQAPEVEMAQAKTNVVPAVPAPAPASPTQALPPGKPSNGAVSKPTAKKALATTKPSNS